MPQVSPLNPVRFSAELKHHPNQALVLGAMQGLLIGLPFRLGGLEVAWLSG